jgi:hypothetical protein
VSRSGGQNTDQMPKRGRPPSPKGQGLETEIKIRVRKAEKAQFDAAAKRVPTTLSNWARVTLIAAAGEEKKGAKQP